MSDEIEQPELPEEAPIDFGQYAITSSVVHYFEKEPKWWWNIQPVNAGMELELSKFMVHRRLILLQDGSQTEATPTGLEIAHREIALTFGGTNLPKGKKPVEDGGEPYIEKDAPVFAIEAALRRMPHGMVMEIWKAVGKANPGWGPKNPKSI